MKSLKVMGLQEMPFSAMGSCYGGIFIETVVIITLSACLGALGLTAGVGAVVKHATTTDSK